MSKNLWAELSTTVGEERCVAYIQEGKVKKTHKEEPKARSLSEFLNMLRICSEGDWLTLKDFCKGIAPLLEPLLEQLVFLEGEDKDSYQIYLEDYDGYLYRFISEQKCTIACGEGVPAFTLRVVVKEYSPTTMSLEVNRVYFDH
jgi:hypothetical protein